eukprot:UN12792
MSEERVRKLSGQINEDEINELLDQYDNNQQTIAIGNEEVEEVDNEDELISPSSGSGSESGSLNEKDRVEIENFKLKLDDVDNGND